MISFDDLPRDCWLEIDAAQLAENIRRLQAVVERPVLVAVKANGYGHGYAFAAKAFLKGGAKYLATANYAEAMILRDAGITSPILIMSGMLLPEMKLAAAAGFEFFVFRPDHVKALHEMPKGSKPIRVHIKVDTGMGRIGCFPNEVAEIGTALKLIPGVTIAGLATHFAVASKPNNEHTNGQIEMFEQAIAALAAVGIRPEIIHAANSSGALYHPRARFDMVRLGIVAYGAQPSSAPGTDLPQGVKTALSWKARVTSSKILPKGSKVSYGCEYEMPKDARVGVLPFGYADGYRRVHNSNNSVLIDDKECKLIGRTVNMDQCMVDLDGFPDITGAEAVLLGRQGDKEIDLFELARRWSIHFYDVYTGIATRVPRKVVS